MENEVWLPVVGYEGFYEVSSFGNLRGLARVLQIKDRTTIKVKAKEKVLTLDNRGYLRARMCKGRTRTQRNLTVHRLVCKAFHKNPMNKPCVNHKDGNKLNNNSSNLEWVTYKENSVHARDNGLLRIPKGEFNGISVLNNEQVISIFNDSRTHIEISKDYNVVESCIGFIKRGITWSHVTGKQYKRFRLTEKDNEDIRRQYADGISIDMLSVKYNRKPSRIMEIIGTSALRPKELKSISVYKTTSIKKEIGFVHGTIYCYQKGCRCTECKSEGSRVNRTYREKHK